MSRAILQADEWLVFELDGVSFALPNTQSQQIGTVNDLLSNTENRTTENRTKSKTKNNSLPYVQDKQGHNIYMLDHQLKPDLSGIKKRILYLLLSDNDKSIGLLCDSADIISFNQHNIQAYSIPITMSYSESPLLGIALSGSGLEETKKPIYLSQAKNIMIYIQNLYSQKIGIIHE